MTAIHVGVTIWWKAILINAVLISLGSIFQTGIGFLLVFVVVVLFGYFVTFPLLPLIALLMKLHTKIPYGNVARIAWLRCMLVLVVWFVYCGFTYVTEDSLWKPEPVVMLIGAATSIAVLAAIAFSRKSINQLLDSTPCKPGLN